MKTTYQYSDGRPVPAGYCVMPEVTITTFTVTVRSQYPVYPGSLRDLIQARYEVTDLAVTDEVVVVK